MQFNASCLKYRHTMKLTFITLCLTFIGQSAFAQQWLSYAMLENGDTINRIDSKNMKQGVWLARVAELRGEPGYEEEGTYRDDKKEGIWRRFNPQGDMLAVEQYKRGFRDGKQMYFTMMGELLREESWRSVDPENPYDTIDVPDLHNPMLTLSKVIKHEAAEVKHGPWKYFDPTTGMLMRTENYISGQKEKPGMSGQASTPASADAEKKKPKPSAVEEWEKKNAGKKKVAVRDGRTGG